MKKFNVTLLFRKGNTRATVRVGNVVAVPGEDIFSTARRTYAKRAKRAAPVLVPGRSRAMAA